MCYERSIEIYKSKQKENDLNKMEQKIKQKKIVKKVKLHQKLVEKKVLIVVPEHQIFLTQRLPHKS